VRGAKLARPGSRHVADTVRFLLAIDVDATWSHVRYQRSPAHRRRGRLSTPPSG